MHRMADEKPSYGYRFRQFCRDNPHVERLFVQLARDAKLKGKRVGIKTLFEVVRWHCMIKTTDTTSSYKLNNDYCSRYARLIMLKYSDLRNMFELRQLRTT